MPHGEQGQEWRFAPFAPTLNIPWQDEWLSENVRHVLETPAPIVGGITSAEEEEELQKVNGWIEELGFKPGVLSYDYADENTGDQVAVFDLVWPDGIQQGLTEPIALLLDEGEKTIALANEAGLRCFTSVASFKEYVEGEVLGEAAERAVA